jgi:hypothetical protein
MKDERRKRKDTMDTVAARFHSYFFPRPDGSIPIISEAFLTLFRGRTPQMAWNLMLQQALACPQTVLTPTSPTHVVALSGLLLQSESGLWGRKIIVPQKPQLQRMA